MNQLTKQEKNNYKKNCIAHYNRTVERYIQTYQDDYTGYPGNKKRYEIIESLIQKHSPEKILYIGCGACIPMVKIMKKFNCIIHGIDFSQNMIDKGKQTLKDHGFSTELILKGDVEDFISLPDDIYDFVIAAGVFTHLPDDNTALKNIHFKLKNAGILAVEFRNELFSLFSFNKYSYDFIVNKLICFDELSDDIKDEVELFFKQRFKISNEVQISNESTFYSNGIIKKFHNPLTIHFNLKQNGFSFMNNYFYHYHALPTYFSNFDNYNNISSHLENPNDWKGHFLASAFVCETKKF